MRFDIQPYKSVGVLCWGMSRQEVEVLLGKPDRVIKNSEGNIVEFRFQSTQSCIFEDEKLIEVCFSKDTDVCFFQKIDLLSLPSRNVVRALLIHDEKAVAGYGSIVFPRLGISLTGFIPEDNEIKAVSAFSTGCWDSLIPSMKAFTLSDIK